LILHEEEKKDIIKGITKIDAKKPHQTGRVLDNQEEGKKTNCTSHQRTKGMCTYKHGWGRLKWKVFKGSNTKIQTYATGERGSKRK
jgi:hypothetical protein